MIGRGNDARNKQTASGAPTSRQRFPKSSVLIGIVGGAILGIVLAQGILSIVAWRREVRQQRQDAAAEAAAAEMAKQKQASQENSPWFRWATQERTP